MQNKGYKISKITQGRDIDILKDHNTVCTRIYIIDTCVVKLDKATLNAWLNSELKYGRENYETAEEWEAYRAEKVEKRAEIKDILFELVGFEKSENASITITRNVSEIFTLVRIEKVQAA